MTDTTVQTHRGLLDSQRDFEISIKENSIENSNSISDKQVDESDFEILSNSPYNVVLQNKIPEKDDGSLSWEALRRNVRYLNIETRLGYLSKQKAMLKYIEENLN